MFGVVIRVSVVVVVGFVGVFSAEGRDRVRVFS